MKIKNGLIDQCRKEGIGSAEELNALLDNEIGISTLYRMVRSKPKALKFIITGAGQHKKRLEEEGRKS